jgi:hypothetical protein
MNLRAAAAAAVALFTVAHGHAARAQVRSPSGSRSSSAAPEPKVKAQPVSIPPYPGGTRLRMRDELGGASRRAAQGALARSESHAYASKDEVAKIVAFYDAALTKQGFTRRSRTEIRNVGRLAAYWRGTTSVSLQAYSDRNLWESYVDDGQKAPLGTNGVFVVVKPGS